MRNGINVKNEITNGVANTDVSAERSMDDVSLSISVSVVIANVFGATLPVRTGLFKKPRLMEHTTISSIKRRMVDTIVDLICLLLTNMNPELGLGQRRTFDAKNCRRLDKAGTTEK